MKPEVVGWQFQRAYNEADEAMVREVQSHAS